MYYTAMSSTAQCCGPCRATGSAQSFCVWLLAAVHPTATFTMQSRNGRHQQHGGCIAAVLCIQHVFTWFTAMSCLTAPTCQHSSCPCSFWQRIGLLLLPCTLAPHNLAVAQHLAYSSACTLQNLYACLLVSCSCIHAVHA